MTETTSKLAVPTFTKHLRKEKGWTQERLGQEAGLSAAAVHNLEAGKNGFTDKTLRALADALGCEPWQLLVEQSADGKITGEQAIKRMLLRIDGLPAEAINPLWRLISGYIEDAG